MTMNLQSMFQMMSNPQVKAIMNSSNPKQMALNMLRSNGSNNAMTNTIVNLLESNDASCIEEYGRNLLASQGINPDDAMKMFKSMPR